MRLFFIFLTILITFSCNPNETNSSEAELAVLSSEKVAPQPEPQEPVFSVPMTYLMGKFDPKSHEDFIKIERQFADRDGMYLRKDTYAAFKKMHAAAASDGVNLVIRSATRNFQSQKRIWEAKWTGSRKIENGKDASKAYPDPKTRALKILEYSSMPSTSRHHWGTDIDLNSFNNEWFEQGEGLKIYNWLQANAANYGFCQPYSPKDQKRPNGYNEERWHWSYMPISKILTCLFLGRLQNKPVTK